MEEAGSQRNLLRRLLPERMVTSHASVQRCKNPTWGVTAIRVPLSTLYTHDSNQSDVVLFGTILEYKSTAFFPAAVAPQTAVPVEIVIVCPSLLARRTIQI